MDWQKLEEELFETADDCLFESIIGNYFDNQEQMIEQLLAEVYGYA